MAPQMGSLTVLGNPQRPPPMPSSRASTEATHLSAKAASSRPSPPALSASLFRKSSGSTATAPCPCGSSLTPRYSVFFGRREASGLQPGLDLLDGVPQAPAPRSGVVHADSQPREEATGCGGADLHSGGLVGRVRGRG